MEGCLPAPTGSLAEMGALEGAHAFNAPSSGMGYTPAHSSTMEDTRNVIIEEEEVYSFGQPARLITCANHGNDVICS